MALKTLRHGNIGAVDELPRQTFCVFPCWHKTTLSRNAAQIGVDVDQFDGHFIMLPAPLVGHDIGVSDHGGMSQ
jgi:hypothetical protein